MITLEAKLRQPTENLEKLRTEGMVPAVFYGAGKQTTMISVSLIDFTRVFREAGESTPVTLKTPEGTVSTLVHEVQHHPVNGMPFHIDFLVVDIHKPVEVHVPLEFVGVAPAVKGNIGTLVKVLHEVEIKALPNDLPHGIEVDISVLENADSQIHASDLKLPKGVTLVTEADEVVASIAVAQEETEEASPVDLASIEVEKKGKKEEETEA